MAGSAREEAERLVAAVMARAASDADSSGTRDTVTAGLGSLADSVLGAVGRFAGVRADEHKPSSGWSTGSAECCVCPVCRAIALVRDPSPQTAVRLASSAGDIATGLASVMRGLSGLAGDLTPKPQPRPAPVPNPDETWSAATRAAERTTSPSDAPSFLINPKNPAAAGEVDAAAAGLDPWAAASAASAAVAERDRVAREAVRREAAERERVAREAVRREAAETARAAAREAARRVAEAAALAQAAKSAARGAVAETGAGTEAADTDGAGARSGGGAGGKAPGVGARSGGGEERGAGGKAPGVGARSGGGEERGAGGKARGGGARSGRTRQGFDVWAAATAEPGVGDVAAPTAVDHDVSGAAAPGERDGAAGDAAPGDGAV